MHVTTSELFLIAMFIILAIPFLAWRLLGRQSYAPLVVVQIVGGILLGPGVLGGAFPAYYSTIFTPEVIAALNGIAWWAVMMFVFVAGLELNPREAWARRGETATVAGFALVVPMLFGVAAAALMLRSGGWIGAEGQYWQVLVGIGMACAVTALPILVLFLDELGILRHPFGQRVLRYASLDDIAIWAVLALILLDWERILRQIAFLAVFTLAAAAMRWLIPRLKGLDRWYVGLAWLAAAGLAGDWAGLHFMVGAFLAGAALDQHWFGHAEVDRFRDNVLMAVMPVFFLSTGLRTGWDVGGGAVFAAAGLLLVASVAGKIAGIHIAGRILGWARGEATVIGWLLQTKALIMIIFANVMLDKQVISSNTFTALLLMAVASTMLTMPMALPRIGHLAPNRAGAAPAKDGSGH